LKPYIESVQPKENAKLLTDLNKFNEWLD
jgi:hypothetical protein